MVVSKTRKFDQTFHVVLQSQSLVNVCGDVVQVLYQVDFMNYSNRVENESPLIPDLKTFQRPSSPKFGPKILSQRS